MNCLLSLLMIIVIFGSISVAVMWFFTFMECWDGTPYKETVFGRSRQKNREMKEMYE